VLDCGERIARKGVAVTSAANSDVHVLDDLHRYFHTQIDDMPDEIADLT